MINRASIVEGNFIDFLQAGAQHLADGISTPRLDIDGVSGKTGVSPSDLLEIFESQMMSRHLDIVARELRAEGKSFYTIGSAGHEGNAVLGRLTRKTDPAFLHYRSGGFMAERSRKDATVNFVRDTVLSLIASAEDPISGGRHKVWGSRSLWVLPQTSTIASHLPKAFGMAFAIERAKRLACDLVVPGDSVVLCSFGDASVNHSTAQGALNAAAYAYHQKLPVPIVFICEDNGLGISVPTASQWLERFFSSRYGLSYFAADGTDLLDACEKAHEAVSYCRSRRAPVLLHLKTVRLLGHAGSDVESSYRRPKQIEGSESVDPLLRASWQLCALGFATPSELLERYRQLRSLVWETAEQCLDSPRLSSSAQIMQPLAPYHSVDVDTEARQSADPSLRIRYLGHQERLPENQPEKHLAAQINRALCDLMIRYPQMVLFGEDVAQKGGVYHVTADLQKRFGSGRVFNTLLDEQTIFGLAQGFSSAGLLPCAEIQYLAYIHNAIDQLRGEACSLQFFSQGMFKNPFVVRVASFAYQKGFGGHFHNDNSIAALRDIPGLIIAAPARGDDAVGMLRTCFAAAVVDGRVVAFLEPIARYMTKDLFEPGDGAWLTAYPKPGQSIPLGEGRVYHPENNDLTIVSYANGVYLSLRAARVLKRRHRVHVRVVDLRWLAPLNTALIVEQAKNSERILIVDEGRRSGGIAEAVVTAISEGTRPSPPVVRLCGEDSYIPLGPAANHVLPTEQAIIECVLAMCRRGSANPMT